MGPFVALSFEKAQDEKKHHMYLKHWPGFGEIVVIHGHKDPFTSEDQVESAGLGHKKYNV